MLKEITEIVTEVENHKMIKFLFKNEKKLVLYGAATFCNSFLLQAKNYDSLYSSIIYIIDNDSNKNGKNINGIEIKSLDDILHEIHKYKFLITTTTYLYSVAKLLQSYGVTIDDIYAPDRDFIYAGGAGIFQQMHAYLSPIDVYENKEHYINTYNLLSDEKSKKIYRAILLYRLYGIHYQCEELYNDNVTYFNNNHIKLGTQECFVDVGAYNGDSIIDFIRKTDNQYSKIYAIEANKDISNELKKRVIDDTNKERIDIINMGVGSTRKTISYDGFRGNTGNDTLEIYPIDEILSDKNVTIIKMDIEGMELEALKGAVNIIQSQKPVLAICIYHLVQDIWKIIELIHDMLPEYKFCIEQPIDMHMVETVVYAFVD